MELIDISIPDHHFWHEKKYEKHRNKWVYTGDKRHLAAMLKCIAYASREPESKYSDGWAHWNSADSWRDDETFGRPGEMVKTAAKNVSKDHRVSNAIMTILTGVIIIWTVWLICAHIH